MPVRLGQCPSGSSMSVWAQLATGSGWAFWVWLGLGSMAGHQLGCPPGHTVRHWLRPSGLRFVIGSTASSGSLARLIAARHWAVRRSSGHWAHWLGLGIGSSIGSILGLGSVFGLSVIGPVRLSLGFTNN